MLLRMISRAYCEWNSSNVEVLESSEKKLEVE